MTTPDQNVNENLPETITIRPPSWAMLGALAIEELRRGKTEYTLGLLPLMIEKLMLVEMYANENGYVEFGNGSIQQISA